MDYATKRHKAHAQLVCTALKACGGSQTELAELMGSKVRQGHVYQWKTGAKLVGPHYAVLMERAVHCAVRREQFYPELYEGLTITRPERINA